MVSLLLKIPRGFHLLLPGMREVPLNNFAVACILASLRDDHLVTRALKVPQWLSELSQVLPQFSRANQIMNTPLSALYTLTILCDSWCCYAFFPSEYRQNGMELNWFISFNMAHSGNCRCDHLLTHCNSGKIWPLIFSHVGPLYGELFWRNVHIHYLHFSEH